MSPYGVNKLQWLTHSPLIFYSGHQYDQSATNWCHANLETDDYYHQSDTEEQNLLKFHVKLRCVVFHDGENKHDL